MLGKREFDPSRRHLLRKGAILTGGGAVVLLAPDVLKRGATEGIKGVIEGLNPFTPQEQERILGVVPEKLSKLNDIGLVRRSYLVTAEADKKWKWIPQIVAGEKVTLTTRWRADWKIQNFSNLTEPGKVIVVPEQRLVVLTLPRPKATDISIDPTFTPKISRRPGAVNGTFGLGTLIEEHDFNEMNLKAMRLQVDADGEAAEFADRVGMESFADFCTGLLQRAGCINAQFQVAYEGSATIADLNLRFNQGIQAVSPDGPAVPLQIYSPPDPEALTQRQMPTTTTTKVNPTNGYTP